jgi:hypothetical protein
MILQANHPRRLSGNKAIALVMVLILAACGGGEDPTPTVTLTPVPTSTNTPQPTATTPAAAPTLIETPTETPLPTIELVVEAAEGEEADPPIAIDLPDDWLSGNGVQSIQDIDGMVRLVPFTKYVGPVTGGTGNVVLLWGFPNVGGGNPLMPTDPLQSLLRLDGLRLLRLAVFEAECTFGTDLEREYTFMVGGQPADGTWFQVVQCPEEPDTRGWFAGLQVDGLNFMFYVYTDPIEAMDGPAVDTLQSILDSVEFEVQAMLASMTPEEQ